MDPWTEMKSPKNTRTNFFLIYRKILKTERIDFSVAILTRQTTVVRTSYASVIRSSKVDAFRPSTAVQTATLQQPPSILIFQSIPPFPIFYPSPIPVSRCLRGSITTTALWRVRPNFSRFLIFDYLKYFFKIQIFKLYNF